MGYLIGYHTSSPPPQLTPFEPSALLRRRSSTPVVGYRYRLYESKDKPYQGETPVIVAEAQLLLRGQGETPVVLRRTRRTTSQELTTSQKIKLPPIKLRSISHEDIFHKHCRSYLEKDISNDLSAAAAADKELLGMCHRGVFLLQIESSGSGSRSRGA